MNLRRNVFGLFFLLALAICQTGWAENYFQVLSAFRGLTISAPRISNIGPDSFFAQWDAPLESNFSTHYQMRINGRLYGASTRDTSKTISWLIPGNTVTADYVIYHNGTILGISSSTRVLTAPEPPSGLFADRIGTTSFRLTWLQTPSATAYTVFIDGFLVQTLPATTLITTITNLQPGKKVKATLVASNASGNSHLSQSIEVQLLPPPPGLSLTVGGIGQTSFGITWNRVEGAASYTIFRDGVASDVVGAASNSFVFNGLTPGASYTSRVMATNISGYSELSNQVSVLLLPPTPDRPIASIIGTNSFWLEWMPLPNVTGYKVYRDFDEVMYNLSSVTRRVFCNRGFNPGDTASMSVSCSNATGDSPQSPALTVILLSVGSGSPLIPAALLPAIDPNGKRLGDNLADIPIPSPEGKWEKLSAKAQGKPVVVTLLDSSNPEILQHQYRLLDRVAQTPEFQHILFIGLCSRQVPFFPPLVAVSFSFDQTGGIAQSLAPGKGLPVICILDSSLTLRSLETGLNETSLRKRLCETLGITSAGAEGEQFQKEKSQFDSLHRSR